MKTWKNIARSIGLIVYRHTVLITLICLFLMVFLVAISAAIKDVFQYWYILLFVGFSLLAFLLVGLENSNMNNYKVAVFVASKLYLEIIESNLVQRMLILDKLTKLMEKTIVKKKFNCAVCLDWKN